jgi:site-specific DNA-cytosine methylase
MKVLVACEESQAVCIAFRAKGHEAYSCDLEECSGGHPEWHIRDDAIAQAYSGNYEMMIGFPPCTHIANAGGVHFKKKREDGRQKDAILFFKALLAAPILKIAIENPVGILSSDWYIQKHYPELIDELKSVGIPRKPDQVIQPFYFGDPTRKYTCLWMKGLKPLVWSKKPTLFEGASYVEPEKPSVFITRKGPYRTGTKRAMYWQDLLPKKDRAKIKSKTFPGIARAMAEQWG